MRLRARGFTILELVVVLGITGIVIAGITKTMIDLDRTSNVRRLNTQLQGEGREGMRAVEREIRNASLGASLGVIWSESGLNVAQDPAVQIFDNVAEATGFLGAKVGTDALLVVGAVPGPAAALVGTSYRNDPAAALPVSDPAGMAVGVRLLIGPYRAATWDAVSELTPKGAGPTDFATVVFASGRNVFPDGKMDSGSMVRVARARLYFVNAQDQLVRAELRVPRAPADGTELVGSEVLAEGIENLQVTCETHDGVSFGGCPGGDAAATAAFGQFAAGGGRRITGNADALRTTMSQLRTVTLAITARSRRPVADYPGDPAVQLDNDPPPSTATATDGGHVRRVYRLTVAVRNTSLEVL